MQQSNDFLPKKLKQTKLMHALNTAQKWSFAIKVSSVDLTKLQFPSDLVTFTEEILNGKFHFRAGKIEQPARPVAIEWSKCFDFTWYEVNKKLCKILLKHH